MDLLGTLFIGLLVGLAARALRRGENRMGILATSLLGVGGSALATCGGQALHLYHSGETAGFIGATLGAVLLLVVAHALRWALGK
jgi:uncharacterized membrane protein YeaQ/YmgE (transglycosylase-associated protein family)